MKKKFLKVFNYTITFFSIMILNSCDLMNDRLANVGRMPELSSVNFFELEDGNYNKANQNIKNISDAERALMADKILYNSTNDPQIAVGSNNNRASQIQSQQNQYSQNNLYKTNAKELRPANSLWNQNAQSFFESHKIGDIISVVISISDKARLDNQTQKSRDSELSLGVPRLFGAEKKLGNQPDSLISAESGSESSGKGKINRSEVVETIVAATVIGILPSGNLYIKGSQEVRINYEIRQITVEGIVRPTDLDGKNSVKLEKIAEARISYGGKGQISEYQQDQYGKQIVDIISPF